MKTIIKINLKVVKILTLIFCLFFLLLIIFSIFSMCTQKYKLEYETWFDTKNVFGNGEYQQYSNERGGLDLYNVKYNCSIIFSVVNYVEQDEKVYIKGYIYDDVKKKTFEVLSILDLETNMLKYCVVDGKFEEYYITHCQQIVNKFSDFNSEEQNILKDL
mgnify:CR=1 FL=1